MVFFGLFNFEWHSLSILGFRFYSDRLYSKTIVFFFFNFFSLIFFWHQKSGWTVDFIVHRGVAREMLVSDFILNYG